MRFWTIFISHCVHALLCDVALVSKCVIGIDILSNWQNHYTSSLTCEVRANTVSLSRKDRKTSITFLRDWWRVGEDFRD